MTRSKGRTTGCIGYEIARRLGELGYRVWLGARDAQRGEAAAQTLRDLGHDVRMIDIAVDDDARVKAAAARVTAEDGKLDVLIANAGIPGSYAHPTEQSIDGIRQVYEVNVFGAIRLIQAFPPLTGLGLTLGAAFCGVWVWAAENLTQVEDARRAFDGRQS